MSGTERGPPRISDKQLDALVEFLAPSSLNDRDMYSVLLELKERRAASLEPRATDPIDAAFNEFERHIDGTAGMAHRERGFRAGWEAAAKALRKAGGA